MKILIFVGLALLSENASALDFDGKVFEKDSGRSKILYTLKHRETFGGAKLVRIHREFLALDGKTAVTEEVTFGGGEAFGKYTLQQFQTQEQGALEIKDGKALFSYTKNGKTDTDDEEMAPNFVIGATLVPYLQRHWATIKTGDDVSVRFGVLDRKETVGFKFFKIGEVKFDGRDAIQVKMKPTSFVIAAIVDPLIFTFTPDGARLLALVGRTSPKQLKDGKWKDLDAEIVYDFGAAAK